MQTEEKTGTESGPGTGSGPDSETESDRNPRRAPRVGRGSENGYLPHEKLDAYRVALEMHEALNATLPRRCLRDLRDQLVRASTSVVLNIAEGAGRASLADKRRFYEIARGSATECAAILDLLRLQGGGSAADRDRARRLVTRVVQMLSRLCPVRR